ncbi:MAG: glycosyltransferase [Bacteroidales bacterium]|nr:glycosyltransferase [Bacteroidales bacterium]
MILILVAFVILSFYAALITVYFEGLNRLNANKITAQQEIIPEIGISVVIAMRNEAKNIAGIVDDLILQSIDNKRFELILVDDNSQDNSVEIAKRKLDKTQIRYSILHSDGGKKAALQKGVMASAYEIVAFTDADCRLPKQWLSGFLQAFKSVDIQMVSGPVFFDYVGFSQKMMALEFGSLVASGAASMAMGFPIMVNGANMAVRKTAWLKVRGDLTNNEIADSGDDVFTMSNIRQHFGASAIAFIHSHTLLVTTPAPDNWRKWSTQRLRWASKSKSYRDFYIITTALFISFVSLVQLALLVQDVFFSHRFPTDFLLFTLLKWIPDWIFLQGFFKEYHKKDLLKLSLPVALLYPFYIPVFAIAGLFARPRWKNRRILA